MWMTLRISALHPLSQSITFISEVDGTPKTFGWSALFYKVFAYPAYFHSTEENISISTRVNCNKLGQDGKKRVVLA